MFGLQILALPDCQGVGQRSASGCSGCGGLSFWQRRSNSMRVESARINLRKRPATFLLRKLRCSRQAAAKNKIRISTRFRYARLRSLC